LYAPRARPPGLLAVLLLDVIPREMFREAAAKALGIIAIIAVSVTSSA
jgi:uncharacterized protein (DUF924 family)